VKAWEDTYPIDSPSLQLIKKRASVFRRKFEPNESRVKTTVDLRRQCCYRILEPILPVVPMGPLMSDQNARLSCKIGVSPSGRINEFRGDNVMGDRCDPSDSKDCEGLGYARLRQGTGRSKVRSYKRRQRPVQHSCRASVMLRQRQQVVVILDVPFRNCGAATKVLSQTAEHIAFKFLLLSATLCR
jgi:hypothetical protein